MRSFHHRVVGLSCMLAFACSGGGENLEPAAAPAPQQAADQATAELFPVGRHKARGMLRFRTTDKGVLLRGKVTGLSHGNFGFSIRDRGECTAADSKAVGGYFNPEAGATVPLGLLEDLNADDGGNVAVQRELEKLRLEGPATILGKAIVVHAWPHDPKVEPEDVPLVACGVIRAD